MFTGIVDHCGKILKIEAEHGIRRFWIYHLFPGDIVLGESIAVDGICLTVTEVEDHIFSCDISAETERVTTAKNLQVDQLVNLERALQLSSRLGGHMVAGHVDSTAYLKHRTQQGEFIEMQFAGITDAGVKYLFNKGSISVNGVSVTLNEISPEGFSVMLIPHTLERSNLGLLNVNDHVNIEFDMVAKMLVEQYQKYSANFTFPELKIQT